MTSRSMGTYIVHLIQVVCGLVWFHRPYLPLHSICINAYMQFTYSIKTNPSQKQMQLVVIVLAVDNFSIN